MKVEFLTVYERDILITSRAFEEHVHHLKYVLERLQEGVDSELG